MAGRDLAQLQHWVQRAVMDYRGVAGAAEVSDNPSAEALAGTRIEDVVHPSSTLTAAERLQIYNDAYYLRLVGCLADEFPAMAHLLGKDVFDQMMLGYLQAYPSRSYTLGNLARQMPMYLSETRPPRESDEPDWADCLIDLATVERTYNDVFDGPGPESAGILGDDALRQVPPAEWPECRLVMLDCFRLLELRFPVHEYITAVRRKQPATVPIAKPTWLAITRRDYVVRRYPLTRPQSVLLAKLASGESVGEAILACAELTTISSDQLAAQLHGWFQAWAAAPMFAAIEMGTA